MCDAACRVKIPARRVLGPQLENWEPGTNDHLVLLGRKDVCVAERKVVSTKEIKRGKADIITDQNHALCFCISIERCNLN